MVIVAAQDDWSTLRSSSRSSATLGRASSTWTFRLSILTSPRLSESWDRLDVNRKLLPRPSWNIAEANRATSLFILRDLMLILAAFLHVIAVAGLDPVGAVDFLPYGTLLCHGVNDTRSIGGEGCSLNTDGYQHMYREGKICNSEG